MDRVQGGGEVGDELGAGHEEKEEDDSGCAPRKENGGDRVSL